MSGTPCNTWPTCFYYSPLVFDSLDPANDFGLPIYDSGYNHVVTSGRCVTLDMPMRLNGTFATSIAGHFAAAIDNMFVPDGGAIRQWSLADQPVPTPTAGTDFPAGSGYIPLRNITVSRADGIAPPSGIVHNLTFVYTGEYERNPVTRREPVKGKGIVIELWDHNPMTNTWLPITAAEITGTVYLTALGSYH